MAGVLIGICATTAKAQAPTNSMGVVFHNISFEVPDYDAEVDFWTKFGLEKAGNGNATISIFRCPGSQVSITVHVNKDTAGGSEETTLNHIGFQVPDVPSAVAKWKAAGLRVEPGRNAQQAYVFTPDNVKFEILQDATMTTSIKLHHAHIYVSDVKAAQDYYAKMLGGVPGKRGQFDGDDFPNINLTISKADMPLKSTNGHFLHHLGFGVPDVDEFKAQLIAKGVTFDPALQPAPNPNRPPQFAYFLDPWGTMIQLYRTNPVPGAPGAGGPGR